MLASCNYKLFLLILNINKWYFFLLIFKFILLLLIVSNNSYTQIIGKLDNVADGRYIPEFKVKFSRRPLGLNRLEFIASVIEEEIEQKYGKNTINENDTVHNTEKNSINENDTVQNTEKNTINENDTVEKTEKNNDSENSETQVNTNNIINNRTSLLGVVLSTLSFGYFKDIKSTHNTNNDNKKKELYSVILNFIN